MILANGDELDVEFADGSVRERKKLVVVIAAASVVALRNVGWNRERGARDLAADLKAILSRQL